MKLISLFLMSKNNKKNGRYLYCPVVEIDNKYFYCESIVSCRVISKKDITGSMLKVKRQIEPQFYAANGIVSTNQ